MSTRSSGLFCELPYHPDSAEAFASILQRPWSCLLDSVGSAHDGGFDFLVAQPAGTLLARAGELCCVSPEHHESWQGDISAWLRRQARRAGRGNAEVPFSGGLLGYMGYGLNLCADVRPTLGTGGSAMPDMALGLYDGAVVVDHARRRTRLVAQDDADGQAWLETMREALAASPTRAVDEFKLLATPVCNLNFEKYSKAFTRVAEYIRAGDCYQVNLAMRFSAPCRGSAWPLYQRLRRANPAPYAAWLNYPFGQVLSSSPEQFLALRSGRATTRPIKGTRPRSSDPVVDLGLARALAESPKDQAENLMIVDLLRNDLGKVCVPGSVKVPELFKVENFASVHHLVSTVSGQLAAGKDAYDLLAATFPGGSITGAPKRRAMQIIAELEAEPRGVYCGAIGYIGADGDMDMNIAIRTLTVQDGEVSFWVGSGLVADSDPQAEYQECLDKARVLLTCLESFL